MNKINYIFYVLILLAVVSCTDEDLNPHPEIPNGPMVLIDEVVIPVFNVNDIANATYEAKLRDPIGNVASFDINVFITSGGVTTDTFFVKSITSFPHDLVITAQELVDAVDDLNDVSDFLPGDRIDLVNEIVSVDGQRFTADDQGPDLAGNPGQRSGFKAVTFISCPFVNTDAVGDYTVTNDPFGASWTGEFSVTAGPGEDEMTAVDFLGWTQAPSFAAQYDVVFQVDIATGEATVARQDAWHSGTYGFPYGVATVDGGGFVFSCSGSIVVSLAHNVSIGGWGSWAFEAQRN